MISGNAPGSAIEITGNSQGNLVTANQIGGPAAADRNVISGNGQYGVEITGVAATANLIRGNFIGLASDGATDVGNGLDGVFVLDGSSNTIGGFVVGAGNVISGNDRHGIHISGSTAATNTIQGNYVGTDNIGTASQGNTFNGVTLDDGAHENLIGGSTFGARNIISANFEHGIAIIAETSSNNLVQGNYIGVDSAGGSTGNDLGNYANGVFIEDAQDTLIGGPTPAHGNVISDNQDNGVEIRDSVPNNFVDPVAVVQNNLIGVFANGNGDLGNGNTGVFINAADSNIIGGINQGNVISGHNNYAGIDIRTGRYNDVFGNTVGLNHPQTTKVPNGFGVVVQLGSISNEIGGELDGQGNVISGNNDHGVVLFSAATSDNTVRNNIIGSNQAGASLGNGNPPEAGVFIADAAHTNSVIENDILATDGYGVHIEGVVLQGVPALENTTTNQIVDNLIGSPGLANTAGGVLIDSAARANTVSGNSILGNGGYGVHIKGVIAVGNNNTNENQIVSNTIGSAPSPNTGGGVFIEARAKSNGVGGNIIRHNLGDGVAICCEGTDVNVVSGNFIEFNSGHGVRITAGAAGTIIGALPALPEGGEPLPGNIISGNGEDGVLVLAAPTTQIAQNTIEGNGGNGARVDGGDVRVSQNSIFDNVLLGIDVDAEGLTLNDDPDVDGAQNYPVLESAIGSSGGATVTGSIDSAAASEYIIEFFASTGCDASGHGEGSTYLGATTLITDDNGHAGFEISLFDLPNDAAIITATSTSTMATGDSSEFSACTSVLPGPPPCPADIAPLPNGDGAVNVFDLLALIGVWGACPPPCPPCYGDLSGDCVVNVLDLLALITAWGLCP